MKLNENTRFPHPVLCEETTDYITGNFKVDIEVTEDTVNNSLLLKCITILDEPYLSNILRDKLAKVFLIVSCRGTYFYKQIELIQSEEIITFKPGELTGRVDLRGVIVSTKTISDFRSVNLNQEYGYEGFTINKSEILAFDSKRPMNIGRKKLPPLESIFELAFSDELENGEIDVSLEQNKIQILANKATSEKIHHLRNVGDTSSIVFSAIYLPAIMQILSYLREESGEYVEYAWYDPFIAKCDFYNIDISKDSFLLSAQKLLKKPLNLVMENYNE